MPGTIFTVINNTAAKPITSTSANLADASTFTVGRNTFQVNYEGSTDNDLTLAVLPYPSKAQDCIPGGPAE